MTCRALYLKQFLPNNPKIFLFEANSLQSMLSTEHVGSYAICASAVTIESRQCKYLYFRLPMPHLDFSHCIAHVSLFL